MARPTLDRHPKFRHMMRALNISRPLARGYLELMWDAANESGNPTFKSAEQLAATIDYDGEPCQLTTSLIEIGFLDLTLDGSYEIHDYWHHAPEYVKGRLRKEKERLRKRNPSSDHVTRQSRDCRDSVTACHATPSPSPSPIKIEEESNDSSSHSDCSEQVKLKAVKQKIESVWNALAEAYELPRLSTWNETRTKALRARWTNRFWRENWETAISRVPANVWNLGENDRNWRANIDWFLRDKTVPMLMERSGSQNANSAADPEILAQLGRTES